MLSIHSLSLHHFRNYTEATLHSDCRCIILSGPNGAGKTNILEALSLLTPGRGLRKSKLVDLRCQSQPQPWVVAADCIGFQGKVHIGTALEVEGESEKRLIKIDGEKVRGQTALSAHLSLIWQTPQMDGLFLASDGERRRFLDRLVYQFDAAHSARVNAYDYATRERNRLLATRQTDDGWLRAHEQQMAEKGVAITLARLELIARLNASITEDISAFPQAHLELKGPMEQMLLDGQAAVDVETKWAQKLTSLRLADQSAGRATWGCHRSGLFVTHQVKQMEAAYCSTGEQKALLLSILLAHARARKHWLGAAPILLLDEVVAHLDEQRRAALAEALNALETQAWLTGTDGADFSAFLADAARFEIAAGRIAN